MFTAKSKEVGVIGGMQLTRLEISDLVGRTTDNRQSSEHPLTKSLIILNLFYYSYSLLLEFPLVPNSGLPRLTLSFGEVITQLPDSVAIRHAPLQAPSGMYNLLPSKLY